MTRRLSAGVARSAPGSWFALVCLLLGTGCEYVELRYFPADFGTISSQPSDAGRMCPLPDSAECGATSKCSITRSGTEFDAVCVPLIGGGAVDDTCLRAELGRDDCGRGLLCSPLGEPEREQVCRALCLRDDECRSAERCIKISPQAEDPWGVCVPSCEILADTCGAVTHCTGASTTVSALAGICLPFGDAMEGSVCGAVGECARDLVCRAPDGLCRAYCHDTVPCTGGQVCGALGVPDRPALGVCAARAVQ